MKNSTYTVQIIEPSDGYTLTQNKDIDLKDRIFSKKVFLAVTDSVENWCEITDAEAEALKREQEVLIKAEAEKNK